MVREDCPGFEIPTFERPEGLLAHYTTAETAFAKILPETRLRMSPYRLMQDPVENKDLRPVFTYYGSRQRGADEAFEFLLTRIKDHRDRARLISFTQDVEQTDSTHGCSWARPRMWEQYADTHTGVCLVFDGRALEASIRRQLGTDGWHLGPVAYTDAGIAESDIDVFTDDRVFDGDARDEAVSDFIERYHGDFFFLKTRDWSTEHEVRLVQVDVGDDYGFIDYGDSLRAVILGEQFSPWQDPGAEAACDRAGVELRRIKWINGSPFALLGDTHHQAARAA